MDEFAARAGAGVHPIFSENPLLPILAGERPFVDLGIGKAHADRAHTALACGQGGHNTGVKPSGQ